PKLQHNAKRHAGEREDSIASQAEHLPGCVLGPSCKTPLGDIRDSGLAKPDPTQHSTHIPVTFAQGSERINRLSVDQAEIACCTRHLDVRKTSEQPVED